MQSLNLALHSQKTPHWETLSSAFASSSVRAAETAQLENLILFEL